MNVTAMRMRSFEMAPLAKEINTDTCRYGVLAVGKSSDAAVMTYVRKVWEYLRTCVLVPPYGSTVLPYFRTYGTP